MEDIIRAVNEVKIGPLARLRLYRRLIPVFERRDCDTLFECMGIDEEYDKTMRALRPDHFEDEDEE